MGLTWAKEGRWMQAGQVWGLRPERQCQVWAVDWEMITGSGQDGLSHNGLQMLWGKMFGLYFVHIAIVVDGG